MLLHTLALPGAVTAGARSLGRVMRVGTMPVGGVTRALWAATGGRGVAGPPARFASTVGARNGDDGRMVAPPMVYISGEEMTAYTMELIRKECLDPLVGK